MRETSQETADAEVALIVSCVDCGWRGEGITGKDARSAFIALCQRILNDEQRAVRGNPKVQAAITHLRHATGLHEDEEARKVALQEEMALRGVREKTTIEELEAQREAIAEMLRCPDAEVKEPPARKDLQQEFCEGAVEKTATMEQRIAYVSAAVESTRFVKIATPASAPSSIFFKNSTVNSKTPCESDSCRDTR